MLRSFVAGLVAGLLMVLPAGAGNWTTTPEGGGSIVYSYGNVLTEAGMMYLLALERIPVNPKGPTIYVSAGAGGVWAAGNDANDGMTPDSAIATCGELQDRVDVQENYYAHVILDTEGMTDCTATDFDFSYPNRNGLTRDVGLKISCVDPAGGCPITFGATNPTIAFAHLTGAGGGFNIAQTFIITEGITWGCGSVGSDRPFMILDDGLFGIHLNFRAGAGCATGGQDILRGAQKSRHLVINGSILTGGNYVAQVTESAGITFIGQGQPLGVEGGTASNHDALKIATAIDGVTGSDSTTAGITIVGHNVRTWGAQHASISVADMGPPSGHTSGTAVSELTFARSVVTGSFDSDAGGPIVATNNVIDISLDNSNGYALRAYQTTFKQGTALVGFPDGSGAGQNSSNTMYFSNSIFVPDNTANGQVISESSHVNGVDIWDVGTYWAKGNIVEEYGDTESFLFELNGVSNNSLSALDADRAGTLASAAIDDFFQTSENTPVDNLDQFAGSCDDGSFYYCTCDITGTPAACGTASNLDTNADLVPLKAPIPKELIPGATQDLEYILLPARRVGAS